MAPRGDSSTGRELREGVPGWVLGKGHQWGGWGDPGWELVRGALACRATGGWDLSLGCSGCSGGPKWGVGGIWHHLGAQGERPAVPGGPRLSDPGVPGGAKGSLLHGGTPCLEAPPSWGNHPGKAALGEPACAGDRAGTGAGGPSIPTRRAPGTVRGGPCPPVPAVPGRAAALRSRPPPGGSPLPPDA